MIHYLRNEKGDTLLDLEVYPKEGVIDMTSAVSIEHYTDFLLSLDDAEQQKAKIVFEKLSEVRGWYWEVYRELINKDPSIKDVNSIIELMVQSAAGVTKLQYVKS